VVQVHHERFANDGGCTSLIEIWFGLGGFSGGLWFEGLEGVDSAALEETEDVSSRGSRSQVRPARITLTEGK
jgi:hypothetical protein